MNIRIAVGLEREQSSELSFKDGDGRDVELHDLWGDVGRLALDGKMSLGFVRWICCALIVASSYRRNGGVKTHVAAELRSSRRAVRRMLREWIEYGEVRGLLDELHRLSIDDKLPEHEQLR